MSRRTLFQTFWFLSHLVFVYAFTYSEFPNQIHWIYTIGLFGLGCLLWPRRLTDRGFRELALLVVLYFAAFAIVSFWEQFPGTSVEHGKFELIHIAVAFNAYLLGRALPPERILKMHVVLGIVLMLYAVAQMVFGADVSRYGYGQQLMLCLPAALILGRHNLAIVGILIMMASAHKTPLGSAIVAIAFTFWWLHGASWLRNRRAGRVRRWKRERVLLFPIKVIAVIVVAVVVGLVFTERIALTVARFLPEDTYIDFGSFSVVGEGEDRERLYVSEASRSLLPDYFIQGMGFMNFYAWTGRDRDSSRVTRLGREETGVNLHNSYMTWALEGGLLVVSAVLLMFYRTHLRIRNLLAVPAFRQVGILAVSWAAALLLLGTAHQLHAIVQLWGTIGLIFGMSEQTRRKPIREPRP